MWKQCIEIVYRAVRFLPQNFAAAWRNCMNYAVIAYESGCSK